MLTNFQFCAYPVAALSSLPPKSGQGRLASNTKLRLVIRLTRAIFAPLSVKRNSFFLLERALPACNPHNSLMLYHTSHNTHNAKSEAIEVNLE